MKRILLCLFVVVLPLLASAQISKNQSIWTGSVHGKFSQYKQATIRNPIIDMGAEASAAYFVRDGLAVGLGVSGSWFDNHTIIEESQGYEHVWWNRSGAAMPFVRKYCNLASVVVYAGGGIRVSGDKAANREQLRYAILQESRSSSFLVRPQTQLGAILPLSDRIGLDISAQSSLFPISFNSLQLGLVVLSGAEPVQKSTGEVGFTSPLARDGG